MVGAHKRAIARAKEKLGVDKGAKKRVANRTIQTPQSLRLRDCEAKPRHLEVLTFHTSKHVERLIHRHELAPAGLFGTFVAGFCAATGVPLMRFALEHAGVTKKRL
jgi:hypothetical protein